MRVGTMPRETAQEIDLKAAEWIAKVDRGLSPQEERALDAWLAGDPRRVGAYGKMRATALHTERARALGPSFDPADFHSGRTDQPRLSRRGVLLAGGGAIAASAAGLAAVNVLFSETGRRFGTQIGEVKVTPLEDGSVMTLNTASRVVVDFTDDQRAIRLLEGEALFDVASDAARPFVVDAGGTVVRAVGTSFTVRKLADTPIKVLVREGVVEVSRRAPAAASAPPVRAVANTVVLAPAVTGAAIEATAVAPAAVGRELAWREGRIAFEGETLREAARQFARYSETRIVIDDPAIAAEEVSGLFQANDPVGFARAVAVSFGLHAEIRADEVRIRRGA